MPTFGCRRIPEYSVYGLTLASNRELFALRPAQTGAVPDVTVRFNDAPAWCPADFGSALIRYRTPPGQHPLDNLVVHELPQGFVFRYADETEFFLTPDGREIWSRWPEPATLADTETYFLGPVLGFSLRLRGVLCLHASAVVIDGVAVALVGGSMAGKSTTAGAFAAAGYTVVSDDLVAVRETDARPMVAPAYPYLKVWPESEAILFDGAKRLPRLTPTWDKLALTLDDHGYDFADASVLLGAIVILGARDSGASRPLVKRESATAALLAIVPETYAGYLLDAPMRRTEFLQLGALLARVPAFIAEPSDDPARLSLFVSRIADAVRG